MASKKGLTVKMTVKGARETLAAFNRLPKDASVSLRDASQELARVLAERVKAAARSDSRQAALMAPSVKAMRDRMPVIQVGGSGRVGRNRVPAWKILFGAEFGASRFPQFRPHRGPRGYWFFPSIEANQSTINDGWSKAADDIARRFTAGRTGV